MKYESVLQAFEHNTAVVPDEQYILDLQENRGMRKRVQPGACLACGNQFSAISIYSFMLEIIWIFPPLSMNVF